MSQIAKTVILLVMAYSLYGCGISSKNDSERFITRDGLEPDRWASIWLVKTIIAPESEVIIKSDMSVPGNHSGDTFFAVPQSDYKRTASSTAFASLISGYDLTDPVLKKMSIILKAIETASWSIEGSEADAVERSYRRLQEKYGVVDVPVSCYMSFFSHVYQQLKSSDGSLKVGNLEGAAVCSEKPLRNVKREKQTMVNLVEISELLEEIAIGKKVIFVDTREPEEFLAQHIPGAINIPLREVSEVDLSIFQSAERVVSYCIKDFRGYEVARALAKRGVKNSSTMKPFGLDGWKLLGLPVKVDGEDDGMEIERIEWSSLLIDTGALR